MIVALLALFLSLGGGAYALTAGKNSVKSSSIKNGQVKNADLGKNSVSGSKVQNNSIGAADVNKASLGIRRIGFNPAGCDAVPTMPACFAVIDLGGGVALHNTCSDIAGHGNIEVDLYGEWQTYNLAYIDGPNTNNKAQDHSTPGFGTQLFSKSDWDAVGTLVVKTNANEVITVPFHIYAGSGANCVFEGTATRA